jgi:hypothetical protein
MKRPYAALLILALPLAVSPRVDGAASAAQVTMSASSSAATVGERIQLRVVVRADAGVSGIRVQAPPGAYEIVARHPQPAVSTAAGRTFEEIVTIAFFRTGDFTVGPFQVELLPPRAGRGSEPTGRLVIHVRSLLGENDKDIKPLKEPLAIRGDPRHLLPYAAALLLLLLALLAWRLWRRAKKKLAPDAAPPLPPELELEMLLRELRQKNLPRAGEFRAFFIALSALLKRFIQRAYGFNAEDCTTDETMARLRGLEQDAGIVAGLEAVFTQADLVKFARGVPGSDTEAALWPMLASLIAAHRQRRAQAQEAAHVQAGR